MSIGITVDGMLQRTLGEIYDGVRRSRLFSRRNSSRLGEPSCFLLAAASNFHHKSEKRDLFIDEGIGQVHAGHFQLFLATRAAANICVHSLPLYEPFAERRIRDTLL